MDALTCVSIDYLGAGPRLSCDQKEEMGLRDGGLWDVGRVDGWKVVGVLGRRVDDIPMEYCIIPYLRFT